MLAALLALALGACYNITDKPESPRSAALDTCLDAYFWLPVTLTREESDHFLVSCAASVMHKSYDPRDCKEKDDFTRLLEALGLIEAGGCRASPLRPQPE